MKKNNERPVLITTEFRGVFFGYSDNTKGDTVVLKRARCAIYWATKKGFMELAEVGPNNNSKIGARVSQIEVRKVTAVVEVSPQAVDAWEKS